MKRLEAISILLLHAAMFGTTRMTCAQNATPGVGGTQQTTQVAPPERFYPLLFRHTLYLQQQGADIGSPLPSADISGVQNASSPLNAYFERRVGMRGNEITILTNEARSWKAEADPIDAKARTMIDAIHARTPGGQLTSGQQPPLVPPELIALQQQRDTITLRHVHKLKNAFGADRFSSIDQALRGQVNLGPRHATR